MIHPDNSYGYWLLRLGTLTSLLATTLALPSLGQNEKSAEKSTKTEQKVIIHRSTSKTDAKSGSGQGRIRVIRMDGEGNKTELDSSFSSSVPVSQEKIEELLKSMGIEDVKIERPSSDGRVMQFHFEADGPEMKEIRINNLDHLSDSIVTIVNHYMTQHGDILKESGFNSDSLRVTTHRHMVIVKNGKTYTGEEAEKLVKEGRLSLSSEVGEAPGTKKVIVMKRMDVNILSGDLTEAEKTLLSTFSSKTKEKLSVENFTLGPNPSTGRFRVQAEMPKASEARILVRDYQGKEILDTRAKLSEGRLNEELDLSQQGRGIYFVSIIQGKKSATRKVVVE